jgi:hypothetical protein
MKMGNEMKKKKDEHLSTTFLKSLYQNCDEGSINLRFLPSAKNLFTPLSEIDSVPKILEANKGENVYFGVATRVEGDGTKDGILQIPCLWIDLDLYKLSDEKKQQSRQRYKDFLLKASFIIDSGGGRYLLWMFKEPAPKEEIPRVENLLKRLASYFHGDMGATDASRILRIPGSLNHKYQHIPQVVIKESRPEKQYSLDEFDFLPNVEEIPKREEKPCLPEGWEKGLLDGVSEGERNNAVTKLTGRYLGKGLSKDEILPILLDANSRFKPPLPFKEIETVLDSVIKTHQRNHPHSSSNDDKQPPGVSYRLTTLSDVFEYPEPTFIIDQIIVEGTVSVLGAYTGVGKSVTSLSIIRSILTKDLLWGKYPVIKTGPVLLVDEETPKGFLRERIEKMGFDKGLPFYFLHFQDVRLDRDDCFNALIEKIEEVKPILVVIDSLIRVHRQKEDDSTSMARVVDRLRKIANSGTTVLVIHHHRKGEGPLSQMLRGSSDIPGGVDIEYALIAKDGYLQFSSVKTRTKPLDPIRLRMEISEDGIEIVYAGTEAEEVLTEVTDVLQNKGRLGVNEIWEELKTRDYEIGINRLREVLREAIGKEIQGEKEKGRGKRWVFWVNDSSRFTPIYNTVKSEGTNQDRVDSSQKDKGQENPREERTKCFQEVNDSSRIENQGSREELRNENGYEVMDDGQLTY